MDRYKRSISKKNKIYHPYTVYGIGNLFFFYSPTTGWGICACFVDPSGDVVVSDNFSEVSYYSYGRIIAEQTIDRQYVFCIR